MRLIVALHFVGGGAISELSVKVAPAWIEPRQGEVVERVSQTRLRRQPAQAIHYDLMVFQPRTPDHGEPDNH